MQCTEQSHCCQVGLTQSRFRWHQSKFNIRVQVFTTCRCFNLHDVFLSLWSMSLWIHLNLDYHSRVSTFSNTSAVQMQPHTRQHNCALVYSRAVKEIWTIQLLAGVSLEASYRQSTATCVASHRHGLLFKPHIQESSSC